VAEAPDPTPFVFRRRGLLFGLCFAVSIPLGFLLGRLPQLASLYGVLSLPRPYVLGFRSAPPPPSPVLLVPIAFFALAVALRGWGTSYLRGHVMIDKRLHTDRLIVAGPFRWCRNPLYLGNILLAAGYGFYLPFPGLLLSVSLMAIAVGIVATAEARALRRTYGQQYVEYERSVPMFFPKPPAKDLLRGTPVEPDWANGLAAECWSLFMAGYLACIALRQGQLAVLLAVLAFVGLTLMRRRSARDRAKP